MMSAEYDDAFADIGARLIARFCGPVIERSTTLGERLPRPISQCF